MSQPTSSGGATVPWKEIRIPVPWGHIAAKEWGNKGKSAVLAVHGWQDNCGSFDRLIPLLHLSEMHIVAIDLPGQGLSSQKPPGTLYHICDSVIDVRRVVRHLEWKKYSIIGHSLGGAMCVLYASIYSSEVQKLIILDSLRPIIDSTEYITERMAKGIDELFYFEERMSQPPIKITKDDAVQMVADAMYKSCSKESAEILLKRGVDVVDGGKLILNRDPRLKCKALPGLGWSQMVAFAENIKCEYMLIRAKRGLFPKFHSEREVQETLAQFKKGAKKFELVEVDGTHHVHLNEPERVAPYINRFLMA